MEEIRNELLQHLEEDVVTDLMDTIQGIIISHEECAYRDGVNDGWYDGRRDTLAEFDIDAV